MTQAPAYYAARPGRGRDWWTLLHPPYTAWHLSYVAIGAALAPRFDGVRLAGTMLAFFAAVGIAAHALDELQGRPLRTRIPTATLVAASVAGLAVALALGVAGIFVVGPGLAAFMAVGPVLVLGYNLELLHGWIHTTAGFAVAWGAFPVLTAYFAQSGRVDATALLAAAAAVFLSIAQRVLSTRARDVRRRAIAVTGRLVRRDGSVLTVDAAYLLGPIEQALRACSWALVVLAASAVSARVL